VEIDIPNRSITLQVPAEELDRRRREEEARGDLAFRPQRDQDRTQVPAGLRPFCRIGRYRGGSDPLVLTTGGCRMVKIVATPAGLVGRPGGCF
jgi:hypothetical protein